jgi:WD40 repeat protein
VTFLKEINENTILTGSYDCTLKLWDARKITQELEEFNTGRQIWDLNFYDDSYSQFAIASVYDGYQICRTKTDNFSLVDLQVDVYEGHESICYGSQFVGKDKILTSSFYDSQL